MKSKELLELIDKQWATTKDIQNIGSCGRDKANKIKKEMAEKLGDAYFLPSGQVPMEKVIEYFRINIKHLKMLTSGE